MTTHSIPFLAGVCYGEALGCGEGVDPRVRGRDLYVPPIPPTTEIDPAATASALSEDALRPAYRSNQRLSR
jgi:hypothetical protein